MTLHFPLPCPFAWCDQGPMSRPEYRAHQAVDHGRHSVHRDHDVPAEVLA